jgi:inner membrane protein
MDPLAHSLFGATLAGTRLGRGTGLAVTTAVVAANVPDLDVIAYVESSDAALAFRRGWTHGPLGLALLPALVVLALLVLARLPILRERVDAAPRDVRRLLLLAYIAAVSHPALDWLNSYGVRLLMPFDRRWFYGDTLFIVDPWMWLLLGSAVFLAHRATRRTSAMWAALVVAASLIVIPPAIASTGYAVVWLAAVAAVAMLKWHRPDPALFRRAPEVLLAAFAAYVGLMTIGTRVSRHLVATALARQPAAAEVEKLMVGPLPVTPFEREVVWATADEIRHGSFHWLHNPRFTDSGWSRPRLPDTAPVRAALADPCIAGFVGWARFPFAEVDDTATGHQVYLLDARYARQRGARFGEAAVHVDP